MDAITETRGTSLHDAILTPSMIAVSLSAAAAAAYLGAAFALWKRRGPWMQIAGLALLLHFAALAITVFETGHLRIGITEAASMFAWQASTLLWIFAFRQPIASNGLALFPLAAALALLAAIAPSAASNVAIDHWQVSLHIILSLLSAGVLTVVAAQALALAAQDKMLRTRRLAPVGNRMPPLQTMEQVLFQMIMLGFVLLSLSLLSGLWFVHDWLEQHLAHKTVLSISAWLIFGILIWGRWKFGWRGRTAIRWALTGYATLILAYFGSKLILEVIFNKQWFI